jgi:7-carboxy-7-deazaguanine synthase
MNKQPTEPVYRHSDGLLELHSIFYTIQGEGPFAGTPAVFVRLAGCNLQCPWCDTDYTSKRRAVSPSDLLYRVCQAMQTTRRREARRLVVVTGGEPFRQYLGPFVRLLYGNGFDVQIETNGTLYDPEFPYQLATVVCSPKTPRLHPKLVEHISALKYVLDADHVDPLDGLPSATMGTDHAVYRPCEKFKGEVFVQPLDVSGNLTGQWFVSEPENQRHLQATVQSCMRHGHRLCIQTHKIAELD